MLEQQIRSNLFTVVEVSEITRQQERINELARHTTKAIRHSTNLTLSWKDRHEEVKEADKKVIAYDEELLACYAKIEQWVELGKQRGG